MNQVIIDIDSTLVEFCEPLYQEIIRAGCKCPPPWMWYEWKTPEKVVGNKSLFYQMIDNVHRNLLDMKPFPLAKELLDWLTTRYEVIIASHRNTKFHTMVKEWLGVNDLLYDRIILSYDKTVLFDDTVEFIFDDCPKTLYAAAQKHIQGYQLYYPYNRGCAMTFHNIGHFLGYLMNKERNNEL